MGKSPRPDQCEFPLAQGPGPHSTGDAVGMAEVAVEVVAAGSFHYSFNAEQAGQIKVGQAVSVPFRGRPRFGVVLALLPLEPTTFKLQPILKILEPEPLLPETQVPFLRWIADTTFTPLGEVLKAAVPAPLRQSAERAWRLCCTVDEIPDGHPAKEPLRRAFVKRTLCREKELFRLGLNKKMLPELRRLGWLALDYWAGQSRTKARHVQLLSLTAGAELERIAARAKRQREIFEFLQRQGRTEKRKLLQKFPGSAQALKSLVGQGLLHVEEREERRDSLFSRGERVADQRPELIPEQQAAFDQIRGALEAGNPQQFLLFGITGSGKTEVYMRAIEVVLAEGKNALTLVPEIALTPQLVNRYRARFGEGLAVFHSGLRDSQRFEQWLKIRHGECRIVVGVRSAILTPLANLGLLIVDEEHEPSYKQEERFLYHARELAEKKAADEGAVLVLGSATPALESFSRAEEGKLSRLTLTTRPTGQALPEVKIVDMRSEPRYFGQRLIMSAQLRQAITERLSRDEQAILFLNRRGYFAFLLCPDCGQGLRCPNCAVTLTVHSAAQEVRCHYCDLREALPDTCFACQGEKLIPLGFGTQQLEEEVRRFFPDARVLRMDRDTTQGHAVVERMVASLEKRQVDILIGTQMVAKGLDIPSVTLVGVTLADQSLHFPDFRSAERTFQLLTQVSGRSGRGQTSGQVLIQTYCPEHKSIQLAAAQDYLSFFKWELNNRRLSGYPPFRQLAAMRFNSTSEKRLLAAIDELRPLLQQALARNPQAALLGPAPAPIARLAGRHRYQLLLKHPQREGLAALCASLLPAIQELASRHAVRYKLDLNPYQFL